MVQFKNLVIPTLVLFILFECSLSLEEKPRKTKKWMRNRIDNLPKNVMEDVLVKTLEGEKKFDEGSSQVNEFQLMEKNNQQNDMQN
ncbi:hypothetical protein ACI65C_000638 [Semiaphis heraclei]